VKYTLQKVLQTSRPVDSDLIHTIMKKVYEHTIYYYKLKLDQ